MDNKSLIYWQSRVYQLVFIILSIVLLVFALKMASFVSELVITFGVAILVSYLLGYPVEFLTKYIKVRAISVLIIFSLFLIVISWIGTHLFPIIITQLKALKAALPLVADRLDIGVTNIDVFFRNYQIHLPFLELNTQEIITEIAKLINVDVKDFSSFVGKFLLGSVTVFVYFILTCVFSFYLLLDGKSIWKGILAPLSKRHQEHLTQMKCRVDNILNSYVAGQFMVATLTTAVMLTTYLVLGVPYAFVLGLAQLLEIIPLIGTWTAIIPALIVVAVVASPAKALIAAIVYLIYTQIGRDYLIAPRILGDAIGFHPIGIMFAVIIGAKLGGLAGIIIALPIAAIINEISGYFLEQSKLKIESNYDRY